jgi:hypothetical protein
MPRYAEHTTVTVEKSKAELDSLLAKAGATQRGFFNDELKGSAVVVFGIGGRQVKLAMSLPTVAGTLETAASDPPRGWWGWSATKRLDWAREQVAQAERQRWRGILLCTKAKLELVADGSSSLEREFLADILLPDGSTVGEAVGPRIAEAYATGVMPPMLPAYAGGEP